MTTDERITRLEHTLADAQAELAELKRQRETPAPEVGPEHVGRLVEVRDYIDQKWQGPLVINEVDHQRRVAPFIAAGKDWKLCRLYQGPTRPNWIEHDGGECPLVGDPCVLVQMGDGRLDIGCTEAFWWSCVARYTVIEP